MLRKATKRIQKARSRRWKATFRDTFILLKEFQIPLLWFTIAIMGGGMLYHSIAAWAGEPVKSAAESIYTVLTSAFLQPNGDFPTHIALQMFYFIMPVIGIGILAQGLADFGSAIFNRKNRNKEWEMVVASTLNKHTVLVGLGHLGYRVAIKLYEMGEELVVIELNSASETVTTIQKLDVPVIHDDATRPAVLEAANIRVARTIILASQNDAMNLQIALKARSLNPKIQVVIRIFDEDFAHALQEQFGFIALSATEMAAPVFAAAATGTDVTNPISVEGQLLGLARLTIMPTSAIANKTVGYVEDNYHLNVVLLRHDHQSEMHPTNKSPLCAGDTLAVLGGPEQLNRLMHDNE